MSENDRDTHGVVLAVALFGVPAWYAYEAFATPGVDPVMHALAVLVLLLYAFMILDYRETVKETTRRLEALAEGSET